MPSALHVPVANERPARIGAAGAQAIAPAADPPPALGIADLTELMRSVNRVTEELQSTHVQLQHQVAQLQAELAQANEQLRRTRTLAALGEMAAGIAHEIRNPLASIQLYVQILREDLGGRGEQADVCGKIARAVNGLDAIVRDVLHFARGNRISATQTTAETLLAQALGDCEPQIVAAGVAVERSIPLDPAPIEADAGLLTQAFSNVIRNAVEAMAESRASRRVLQVGIRREGRPRRSDHHTAATASNGATPSNPRAIFTFVDTGPGVDRAIIERMFNPFFTTRPTGTGLGLAIVHRIVDAHGGQVMVSNERGAGARVEISLPLSQPRGAASAAPLDRETQTLVSTFRANP